MKKISQINKSLPLFIISLISLTGCQVTPPKSPLATFHSNDIVQPAQVINEIKNELQYYNAEEHSEYESSGTCYPKSYRIAVVPRSIDLVFQGESKVVYGGGLGAPIGTGVLALDLTGDLKKTNDSTSTQSLSLSFLSSSTEGIPVYFISKNPVARPANGNFPILDAINHLSDELIKEVDHNKQPCLYYDYSNPIQQTFKYDVTVEKDAGGGIKGFGIQLLNGSYDSTSNNHQELTVKLDIVNLLPDNVEPKSAKSGDPLKPPIKFIPMAKKIEINGVGDLINAN